MTEVLVTFVKIPRERLSLGERRVFGRFDLTPMDHGLSQWCGEIEVTEQGALVRSYAKAKTAMWLVPPSGLGAEIVPGFAILIDDGARVAIGPKAHSEPGHSFEIGVTLPQDIERFSEPDFSYERQTQSLADIILTDRHRHAMAALSINYSGPNPSRVPLSYDDAALPGRPKPMSADNIQDASKEFEAKVLARRFITPTGIRRLPFLCNLAVSHGIIGPKDWDQVRPWLPNQGCR